jgi:ribosomal protein S15P/S13E
MEGSDFTDVEARVEALVNRALRGRSLENDADVRSLRMQVNELPLHLMQVNQGVDEVRRGLTKFVGKMQRLESAASHKLNTHAMSIQALQQRFGGVAHLPTHFATVEDSIYTLREQLHRVERKQLKQFEEIEGMCQRMHTLCTRAESAAELTQIAAQSFQAPQE